VTLLGASPPGSSDSREPAAPAGASATPSPSSSPGWPLRRWVRLAARLTAVVVVAAVVYSAVTFMQVWQASGHDESQPAQAIIVLGAAQYDGRPSPVLAARLDHAAALYEQDVAPLIVVTGGRQPGDRYTEAEASANYLMGLGVPGGAIERETNSNSSWESLAAAARFLREDGITEVVLVSDPYHAYRIDAIAEDLGLDAHVSPTRTSPIDGVDEVRQLLRETVAVGVGRIIGYDRLFRLDTDG
jgi:uncharacterized SAM-binding protein YcdF (DUF218 family)